METSVVVAAVVLALVHVVGGKLTFIEYIPRSRWLSIASGVSVAYVFVHLLPEVAERESALADDVAWIVALAGMTIFYALEIYSRRSGEDGSDLPVFWWTIATYAVYNTLVAYLLEERSVEGMLQLWTFVTAMAMHFTINDFALRDRHQTRYALVGRWILVIATATGAAAGALFELPEATIAGLISFIAGGVVLNVLKEELPERADSSFTAFAAGLSLYALLLLSL